VPVKAREAKERRPQFGAEVLQLFLALETTPPRRRKSQTFKDGERELARRLGLVSEWWTGNSVVDRGPKPCRPPGYIAQDWHRCRAIREQLLAATGLQQQHAKRRTVM
jgi:hypothetical protein